MTRVEQIEGKLRQRLEATHVEVTDDSAAHAGHAGAVGGGGHFNVVVVSRRFEGRSRVARNREVYAALEDMMPSDIHALSARTFTPAEWGRR